MGRGHPSAVRRGVGTRRGDEAVHDEAPAVERHRARPAPQADDVAARRDGARLDRERQRARLACGEVHGSRHGEVDGGLGSGDDVDEHGIAGDGGRAAVLEREPRLRRLAGEHVARRDRQRAADRG